MRPAESAESAESAEPAEPAEPAVCVGDRLQMNIASFFNRGQTGVVSDRSQSNNSNANLIHLR
jgi:hypothetical protein